MKPDKIIEALSGYIPFLDSLRRISDTALTSPMEDSLWSVRDVISHIMKWDENFTRTLLTGIIDGKPAVLEEHADVQSFNKEAVEYGRLLPSRKLLAEAKVHRELLIAILHSVPQTAFTCLLSAGGSYTLKGFLYEMFVHHDAHHRRQIEYHLALRLTV